MRRLTARATASIHVHEMHQNLSLAGFAGQLGGEPGKPLLRVDYKEGKPGQCLATIVPCLQLSFIPKNLRV